MRIEAIAAPTVLTLAVCVIMPSNAEIVVVTAALIGFDVVINAAFVVEVLADMRAGAITGGGTGVGAGVNVSGFAAVMTVLEVVAPAPFIEPFLSC